MNRANSHDVRERMDEIEQEMNERSRDPTMDDDFDHETWLRAEHDDLRRELEDLRSIETPHGVNYD